MSDETANAHDTEPGQRVPCKVFEPWLSVFEKAGIEPAGFFESVDLELSHVTNFDNRISWNQWLDAVEALERELGGEGSFEEYFRLADELGSLKSLQGLSRIAGLFASPAFLYRAIFRWFGPSSFPGIEAKLTEVSGRIARGYIKIPDSWRDSAAFFRLNRAIMRDVPTLVGASPARISVEIEPHVGRYVFELPPSGSLTSRIGRAARAAIQGDTILTELEDQNRQLTRSFEELEHANRRLREQRMELAESVKNFRSLIERSKESIAIIQSGHVVYANEAMAEFLSYDSGDALIGSCLEEFMVDPEGVVEDTLDGDTRPNPFDPRDEVRFLDRKGETVLGEVNWLEMEFEGRESTVLISRDVTRRRAVAARMMQMDRMIAVGTLAAGVAHEINNPLTYVVTNTDFSLGLLEQVRDDLDHIDADGSNETLQDINRRLDLIEESLEDARHGGRRVKSIVSDLQTFSRDRDKKRRTVDVHETISNAVKMGSHQLRDRVELIEEFDAKQRARVDASRLGQVLLNLLVNAAHAIEAHDGDENKVWIRTWDRDSRVYIEVEDTGIGISASDFDRIFDPFFTTKPVGKGTGLGLSICKNLISEMDGDLTISSEPGLGTRVEIWLPAASEGAIRDSQSVSRVDPSAFAGHSMLVIDDDPLIGEGLLRLLGTACDIKSVQCPKRGLDIAQNSAPDLLLCDVLMGPMSGLEFFGELQQRAPAIADRLVFMTAGAFSDFDVEQLQNTGRPIVTKPFTLTDLYDAFFAPPLEAL